MSAFSRFAKSFVGLAAPVVGGVLGGPVGAKIGGLIGAGLMAGGPTVGGTGGPGGGAVEVARPAQIPMGAALRGWLIAANGVVRTITGKILGVMRGTSLFRNAKVFSLVRAIGIPGAALALGIAAAEVAEMIAEHTAKPRRRRRGISATDIKRTRSTIGKIRAIERDLSASGICRPRGRARSAPGAGNVRLG